MEIKFYSDYREYRYSEGVKRWSEKEWERIFSEDMLQCHECEKLQKKMYELSLKNHTYRIPLCTDCVKVLRTKIDALALLVVVGEDTK